jgi:hypothetical protein
MNKHSQIVINIAKESFYHLNKTNYTLKKMTTKQFFLFKLLLLLSVNVFAQSKQGQSKRILETFLDAQNKPQYPSAAVYSPSGEWTFDGALLTPNEKNDIRPMAPRLLGPRALNTENGYISSNFEVKGLQKIKVGFIGFKADEATFAIEVMVSKDDGKNWVTVGKRIGDPTKQAETIATFKVNAKKTDAYKIKVVNASSPKANRLSRINITEIDIEYAD